jgi:hypothetical protein
MRSLATIVLGAALITGCCNQPRELEYEDRTQGLVGDPCNSVEYIFSQEPNSAVSIEKRADSWYFLVNSYRGIDNPLIEFDAKTLEEGIKEVNRHLVLPNPKGVGVAIQAEGVEIKQEDIDYIRTNINHDCVAVNEL